MTEQHYRLTLSDAIAQYKAGLINSTGLLYFYIRIKRAEGWKITLYQKVVCEELLINKSTFYKAIAKLTDRGLVIPEESTSITITVNSLQVETEVSNCRPESPTVDLSLQVETEVSNCRPESPSGENETPKQPQGREHSTPTDLLTNSYQIFIKSLSLEEKENFENFCKKKAEEFPKPPTLLKKWIKSNWEDLRNDWYKATNKKPSTANSAWENHPFKDKWIEELNNSGSPVWFYAPGDKLDKEKHNFFKWLCDSGQWGKS